MLSRNADWAVPISSPAPVAMVSWIMEVEESSAMFEIGAMGGDCLGWYFGGQ